MLAQSEKRTGVGRSLAGDWALGGIGFWVDIGLLHFFVALHERCARNLAIRGAKWGEIMAKAGFRLCMQGECAPGGGKTNWRSARWKRDEECGTPA